MGDDDYTPRTGRLAEGAGVGTAKAVLVVVDLDPGESVLLGLLPKQLELLLVERIFVFQLFQKEPATM
jgi:hypothetical protein